jgi:hypothetical protein
MGAGHFHHLQILLLDSIDVTIDFASSFASLILQNALPSLQSLEIDGAIHKGC